jgi:hypothetical protein
MTSDIALSVRPKVSGRLVDWYIPVPSRRPVSGISAANPIAIASTIPFTDPLSKYTC